MIPIVTGALGTISERVIKALEEFEIRGQDVSFFIEDKSEPTLLDAGSFDLFQW